MAISSLCLRRRVFPARWKRGRIGLPQMVCGIYDGAGDNTMADNAMPAEMPKKPTSGTHIGPIGCGRLRGAAAPDGSARWETRCWQILNWPPALSPCPPRPASLLRANEARCLYLICDGYLKLTAGHPHDRQMIVRVAGPGSMLGLYAVLSHGVYEVSAESLTPTHLRPVERERFLNFLRSHRKPRCAPCNASARSTGSPCRTPAASLWPKPWLPGWLGCCWSWHHQIGEQRELGAFHFPCC